ASATVAALATTSMSSPRLMRPERLARTRWSASTTRIRRLIDADGTSGRGFDMPRVCRETQPATSDSRPRRDATYVNGRLTSCGDDDLDPCSTATPRVDREAAADLLGPSAHPGEAQVAGRNVGGVKARDR